MHVYIIERVGLGVGRPRVSVLKLRSSFAGGVARVSVLIASVLIRRGDCNSLFFSLTSFTVGFPRWLR